MRAEHEALVSSYLSNVFAEQSSRAVDREWYVYDSGAGGEARGGGLDTAKARPSRHSAPRPALRFCS